MSSSPVEVVFSFDTTGSMYPCLTQVRRNVKSTVARLGEEIADGRGVESVCAEANNTQCHCTRYDDAACTQAGKHLCTDTEWLSACQGPTGFTYPYGNTRMTGVCNDHRAVHPAVERFGTSASWIWSMLNDACINQLPMSLARTGQFTGCVSGSGAHDMMGNLHEWTADPAGTFRGGYYVDTVMNGNGCLYATTAHSMTYWDYSTGFRCCAAAP